MRKKTIVILTLVGLGLYVVSIIAIALSAITLTSTLSSCSPDCPLSPSGGLIAGLIIGYVILLAGSIVNIVAWVGTLISQAKRQQWAWFVCTILFGIICMWIYLIAVPEAPTPVMLAYYPYPVGQAYQPMQQYQYQPGQAYPPMQAYPYQPGAMQQNQPPWQG